MPFVIEAKNIYVSFNRKKVLKGLTLSLSKGECLALIGGSGEGKSTLLRAFIGLEHPTSGQILFEGNNVLDLNMEEQTSIRKKVSYVFQGGALFDSMTVYDNLAFPLREHTRFSESQIKKEVLQELKEFSLEGSEDMYPLELSGGMQKRLGIARATIIKPMVILYDEPTVGLDPYKKRSMQNTIVKMQKKGTSSVIVTHDMETVLKVCDRIALLQEGKIQAIESMQNFKKNKNKRLNNFVKGIKQGEDNDTA